MLFEYETERLILRIIKPTEAAQVLDFYMRDQELFERFEPDRAEGFYTVSFQKQILSFEYRGHFFVFMCMRRRIRSGSSERSVSTIL